MRLWSDDDGFTLTELLMGMAVFIVVLGATLSIFEGSVVNVGRDTERSHAAEDPLNGVARIVRDLRGAEEVLEMTGNAMDIITPTGGQLRRVRYDCDVAAPNVIVNPYDDTYRRCVRRSAVAIPDADPPALPPLSSAEVVIDRICPGTGTTSCDPVATAPVFMCHNDDGTNSPCAQLPPLPVDPDDVPEPDDEPPAPLFPQQVQVRVVVTARGEGRTRRYSHRVALTDGAYLRNLSPDAQATTQ